MPLTFLFDAVYGLGFLIMFIYMIEKCFGFGKKKFEEQKGHDGKAILDERTGKAKRTEKQFSVSQKQAISEQMF